MHICFLSHEYPLWSTGGIGSFIQTIGRMLVKEGHTVTVVGYSNLKAGDFLVDEGVSIYRMSAPKYFRKASFIENVIKIRKQLKKIHSETPIDIIESNESGLFFLPDKTPYKKVVRMHGGHHFFAESENRSINLWKAKQERMSFKKTDAFVAASKFVINHTGKYLSTGNKPVEIINFPIDSALFREANLDKTIKHKIVFAGTVCEKKGIRQLLQAMPEVKERYPDVKLEIYGRDWFFPDGTSYISYLKTQFSDDILKNVTFHGAINLSEIPSKYEEAELCVFPSHMETLGLVAPEAMMMGKPVLFSNTGPGPEIITHMETGLLCNPLDFNDISSKIIYAFDNPDKMKEIALKGKNYASVKFSRDTNYKHNYQFYQSLKQ